MKNSKRIPLLLRSMSFFVAVCMILFPGLGAWATESVLPEIETGNVKLTWMEFKEILDELEKLKHQPEEEDEVEAPPLDFTVEEADYKGRVEDHVVRFEARFKVSVMKDGWVSVPLFSPDEALESVRIESVKLPDFTGLYHDKKKNDSNEKTAFAQVIQDDKGYSLVADGPGQFTIHSRFQHPVGGDNMVQTINFNPPRSVINRVSVEIPGKGVNVLETRPSGRIDKEEDGSRFQAVLSERDSLLVRWSIEKESGIVREKQAVFDTLASVDKTDVFVTSLITLRHVASLEEIEMHLPLHVEIVNVTSPVIDRWFVEQTEHTQVIRVTGTSDRHIPVELNVSYRQRLGALPSSVVVPVIDIFNVAVIEGYLGVEIQGNLEATSEDVVNGVMVPSKNLPQAIWNHASSPILYGYEYHLNGFKPGLKVKSYQEIQTVLANVDLVDCLTHRTMSGKSVTRIRYFVRNNDRQFLSMKLPEKSRIWQAFLDGRPIKPARDESGRTLIPMKKSDAQGEGLRSFVIEIGYITDVDKLSLKGDIKNELPGIDIPVNYLRWRLFLPEFYGYTKFEGPLKQVAGFSQTELDKQPSTPLLDIPTQGKLFLFEKFLIVDEKPYIKGKYGQFLGDDIFLSLQTVWEIQGKNEIRKKEGKQVVPNLN